MATEQQKQDILKRHTEASERRDAARKARRGAATAGKKAQAAEKQALLDIANIAVEASELGVALPRAKRSDVANATSEPVNVHPDDADGDEAA